jgi:hypothetical protein
MPKEYVNYPSRDEIAKLQISIGMPENLVDGKLGPNTRIFWDRVLEDKDHDAHIDIEAPLPMVGLHWDGKNGTVQLSLDIDWDVLQEMVKARQNNPTENFADDNSFLRNRVTFHTGALSRDDLQQLVRTARRARNAVYGADE